MCLEQSNLLKRGNIDVLPNNQCSHLKSFAIKSSTSNYLSFFLQKCFNLESLKIELSKSVCDADLMVTSRICLKLRSIVINNCTFITNEGIKYLFSSNENISTFKYTEIESIKSHYSLYETKKLLSSTVGTKFPIIELLFKWKRLETLHLQNVTFPSLINVTLAATFCLRKLKSIHLHSVNHLDDHFINILSSYCYNLESFYLHQDRNKIQDESLVIIPKMQIFESRKYGSCCE